MGFEINEEVPQAVSSADYQGMAALTTFPSPPNLRSRGTNVAEIADTGASEAFIPYQRDE